MQLESIALTHQGLIRDNNQDSILALPEAGLFAVADGMGGEKAGDEASRQVVNTLRGHTEQFRQRPPVTPAEMKGLVQRTLQDANRDVHQIALHEPAKQGMGSTASLLWLHRGAWFTGHVGDSRVYLAHGGQIRQLTSDHTLVWTLYERGQITREEMEYHPERHLLTQCIGAAAPVKVDALQGSLHPGDLFLICSDGLTGYVRELRIHEILLEKHPTLEAKASALLNEALQAGGGDNISVVLVRVAALDGKDTWGGLHEQYPSHCDDTITQPIDYNAATQPDECAAQDAPRRRRPTTAELTLSLLLTFLILYLTLRL